jgi:hypothetical protein
MDSYPLSSQLLPGDRPESTSRLLSPRTVVVRGPAQRPRAEECPETAKPPRGDPRGRLE